jgi:hypothetical protein
MIVSNASYTFADYFRLNLYVGDLAEYFGYGFTRQNYALPHSSILLNRLEDLILRLEQNTLYTALNYEFKT